MKEISKVPKKEDNRKMKMVKITGITLVLVLAILSNIVLALEEDHFPNSKATVTITVFGTPATVDLSGPTTVHVFFNGADGNASDTDGDGLDDVGTQIVSMELSGDSPWGPVTLRLRPYTKDPYKNSTGEIEETANNKLNILDVPPFTHTGTAESSFDVYFELELYSPSIPPEYRLLHNRVPKEMRTTITHKPPSTGETYESPDSIQLYNESGVPMEHMITISGAYHTPKPPKLQYKGGSLNWLGSITLASSLTIIGIFFINKRNKRLKKF